MPAAEILSKPQGGCMAETIRGVAVGFAEDGRLVTICGDLDSISDKERHHLAVALAAAREVAESRAGDLH